MTMLGLTTLAARRALIVVASTSLWLLPTSVSAQERDPAAAQALFDQAKDLIRQKRVAEACPKLQESNRLDPGIGTQFNLADCYEQSGRVASAWAAFLDVASQARASGQLDREKAAQKRAEKLQPRLPRLVVTVPEPSKIAGLEIRRNGVLVGAAQWGAPVPVDPGEVELTASAPGKQTLRQALRLEEGKTASYSLPVLAAGEGATTSPVPVAEAPVVAPALVATAAPAAPPREEPAAKSRKNTGWVLTLAGLGVVGLGVGTTFAIMAKGEYDRSKDDCSRDDPNRCGSAGVQQRNSAITKGNIATVAIAAGGVALAGAGVVWLLSGTSTERRGAASGPTIAALPVLGADHAALSMNGSF